MMNTTNIQIYFVDTRKITRKKFQAVLDSFDSKTTQKILGFTKSDDQLLQMASEFLKRQLANVGFYSVSHSEYICVITTSKERIGIDIQKIKKPIKWSLINERINKKNKTINEEEFYKHWTKIEAAYKCVSEQKKEGHLFELEIKNKTSKIQDKTYFFEEVEIAKNYICSVCSSQKIGTISLEEIEIK